MEPFGHGGDVYGGEPIQLDLSINLNPNGAPPQVLAAAQAAVACTRYPDPLCRGVRTEIAKRDRVPLPWVICGNGASDLIFRSILALNPCKAIILAPTFSEYRRGLEAVNCEIMEAQLQKETGFQVTRALLERIEPGVDLVLLCDPNNPTGRLMDAELLDEILAKCRQIGAFLLVDQCFLELSCGDSHRLCTQLEGGGLFLLRALTKSYALAGLRLGYGLCSDTQLLDRMVQLGQPWAVSLPAQVAGEIALQKFSQWPSTCLAQVQRERRFLTKELEELGYWVCPSDSNFLLFYGPVQLGQQLLSRAGILIRDASNFSGLGPGWFRIGLQGRVEHQKLIQALRVIQKGD